MVDVSRRRADSISQTRDAIYLADVFEAIGIPPERLVIDDESPPARAHRDGPVVQLGTDADPTADETAVFKAACNRLTSDYPATRYSEDTRRFIVAYGHVATMRETYDSPAEAGKALAHPDTVRSTMSDGNKFLEREYSVTEIGGQCYAVAERYENDDGDAVKTWFVDMGDTHGNRIRALSGESGDGPNASHSHAILAAVIDAGPEVREGPEEQLSVTVQAPAGGNASGSGSGGNSESDSGQGFQQDASVGEDSDVEAIEEWIENYAQVKGDLDPAGVTVNPGTYDGQEGYEIDTNPFQCGDTYHDGDEWKDQDSWNDVQEAFREIMQDTDPIVYDGDEYLNFLPKSDVDTVTG